jgi:putative component of toxin-antitoxin plasmid stabilization module
MFSIRPLPEFNAWIDGLKDETLRGVIAARIKRLEFGWMGDVQPVGDGVSSCASIWARGGAYISHSAGGTSLCCWSAAQSAHSRKTFGGPKHWPRGLTERRKRS